MADGCFTAAPSCIIFKSSSPFISPVNHHPLALRAWQELYPDKEPKHELQLRFSGRFKGYNAHIQRRNGTLLRPGSILFSLARPFEEVSDEIRLGVMQHLLNKLLKTAVDTLEIRLYNGFIKRLGDYVETQRVDPYLKRRFDQVNHDYFDGYMLTPNLVWGTESLRKLGHYEYATDTISLSTALRADEELLDYVLYHEMLHKKLKFSERAGGFTRSHTKRFREEERQFRMSDGSDPEKRLAAFLRQRKRRRSSGAIFRISDWF